MYWFTTLAALVLVGFMAREIRELRWQNRRMASALEQAHAGRAASDEAARIAGVALLAENAYSEDHRMLVAQAREAIDGDGGRPRQIWVGDTAVEVEAAEPDDVEVGQPVAEHDHSWHFDPYAEPTEVIAVESSTRRGWLPLRRMF